MESLKDFGEPRLVAILEEKGNDEQNLIAVMELYAPIAYPGKNQRRNHVLITIYEKASLPDYIEKTGDKDRILYIKEGFQQTRQADLQLVGAVSKETLSRNVAQFNKKVKAFKDKNRFWVLNVVRRKGLVCICIFPGRECCKLQQLCDLENEQANTPTGCRLAHLDSPPG